MIAIPPGAWRFSRGWSASTRRTSSLPTLLSCFISFCAGLIPAVAAWQRINPWSGPVLAFFAGFAALIGGLYAWLAPMPPEAMAQMIGLLGSGIIVSIIVLFWRGGVRGWRLCTRASWRREGGLAWRCRSSLLPDRDAGGDLIFRTSGSHGYLRTVSAAR